MKKLKQTQLFYLIPSFENRGATLLTHVMSAFNHWAPFIYLKLVNYMYMCEAFVLICHAAREKQPSGGKLHNVRCWNAHRQKSDTTDIARWETATPSTVTTLETSNCNHSVKMKFSKQSRQTRRNKWVVTALNRARKIIPKHQWWRESHPTANQWPTGESAGWATGLTTHWIILKSSLNEDSLKLCPFSHCFVMKVYNSTSDTGKSCMEADFHSKMLINTQLWPLALRPHELLSRLLMAGNSSRRSFFAIESEATGGSCVCQLTPLRPFDPAAP